MELAIDYRISVQSALNINKQVHHLNSDTEEAVVHSVQGVVPKYLQALHRRDAMAYKFCTYLPFRQHYTRKYRASSRME